MELKDLVDLEKLRNNYLKLKSFENFQSNWNDNDAEPFESNLINKVKTIIEKVSVQPKIYPTGRKSIQLEYHRNDDYLEFEVFINKIILFENRNGSTNELLIDASEIATKVYEFFTR